MEHGDQIISLDTFITLIKDKRVIDVYKSNEFFNNFIVFTLDCGTRYSVCFRGHVFVTRQKRKYNEKKQSTVIMMLIIVMFLISFLYYLLE